MGHKKGGLGLCTLIRTSNFFGVMVCVSSNSDSGHLKEVFWRKYIVGRYYDDNVKMNP